MDETAHVMDKLDEVLRSHRKLMEAIPELISSEINKNFISIGIDPNNKIEFQGFMSWLRDTIHLEKEIKSTAWKKFTDIIIIGIVVLAVNGFIYFYMNNQFKAMIRDEKKTELVVEKDTLKK